MYAFANLILALTKMLDILLNLMYWLILIRALISWVNPDPSNPIVQFLYRTTEPILTPIRRLMPAMAIDISPIIAFFLIIFIRYAVVNTLYTFSYNLRMN